MSVSAHARLLLMGIWTEAFDDGVFEWKPLTLKARIFPVDNLDVNELLLDLVHAGCISRIESHPKKPGVIRNFQRYQRPKKPNSSGMLPAEWLDYVGAKSSPDLSDDDNSEPVPHQYGTSSEKSPQMEDGGGRMVSSFQSDTSSLCSEDARAPEVDIHFEKFWEAYPNKIGRPSAQKAFSQTIKRASFDEIMAGVRAYAAKTDDRQWCSPVKWLSDDRWKDQPARPPDKPPPKPNGLAHLQKPQTRAEYLAQEIERSERSFRT
ncbi:hypothetical protein ACCZ74_12250 [Agrobacterium vitis]|uniref:hypothetical protein n=1 Tax=Agrobacterium vitis TaxID=373 RepID=UPI00403ECB66